MPAVEKKVDTKHQLAVDFNIHSLTLQLCIQLMLLLVHVVTGRAAVTKCYIVLVHNDAVLQSARNKKMCYIFRIKGMCTLSRCKSAPTP